MATVTEAALNVHDLHDHAGIQTSSPGINRAKAVALVHWATGESVLIDLNLGIFVINKSLLPHKAGGIEPITHHCLV